MGGRRAFILIFLHNIKKYKVKLKVKLGDKMANVNVKSKVPLSQEVHMATPMARDYRIYSNKRPTSN